MASACSAPARSPKRSDAATRRSVQAPSEHECRRASRRCVEHWTRLSRDALSLPRCCWTGPGDLGFLLEVLQGFPRSAHESPGEHLLNEPATPTWRESKVSIERHPARRGRDWRDHHGLVVHDAERQSNLYPQLAGRIDLEDAHLDLEDSPYASSEYEVVARLQRRRMGWRDAQLRSAPACKRFGVRYESPHMGG